MQACLLIGVLFYFGMRRAAPQRGIACDYEPAMLCSITENYIKNNSAAPQRGIACDYEPAMLCSIIFYFAKLAVYF